jgi:hypothetical protein
MTNVVVLPISKHSFTATNQSIGLHHSMQSKFVYLNLHSNDTNAQWW